MVRFGSQHQVCASMHSTAAREEIDHWAGAITHGVPMAYHAQSTGLIPSPTATTHSMVLTCCTGSSLRGHPSAGQ